jgi:hypothetical protein
LQADALSESEPEKLKKLARTRWSKQSAPAKREVLCMSYKRTIAQWLGDLFRKPLNDELVEVCREIQGLTKRKSDDDEFAYLHIVDIANEFRMRLFDRGILFLPDDIDCQVQLIATETPDRFITHARVHTKFRVVRGRQELTMSAFGAAQDRDGRALATAQTAALKALLKRLGFVFGDRDDPCSSREPLGKEPSQEFSAETAKQIERQHEYQRRAWAAALEATGKTASQVEQYLSVQFEFDVHTQEITELSPEKFDIAITWLARNGDLIDTLEASKIAASKYRPQAESNPPLEATGD